MIRLAKSDFYYGSLLSVMLSNGVKPALFEESKERRIYSFTTNKGGYIMYMKYVSAPIKRKNGNTQLWQFSFSHDEIKTIRNYKEEDKKIIFALICGKKDLKNSEIAILSLNEAKDCLDVNYDRESYRISVKCEKNNHGLRVYGTGRADKLNGKDNTIKISRDRVADL